MRFEILQVKNELTREYGFMSYNFIVEHYGKVELANYDTVFIGASHKDNEMQLLDELFYVFNVDFPRYYSGRSLSVSDVVVLDNGDNKKYFYCDGFGWKEF